MMQIGWTTLWGSGTGPVRRLVPQVRIMMGAILVATCLALRPATAVGAGALCVTTVAWLVACGVRPPLFGAALLLGIALFGPVFALLPFGGDAVTVFARGVASMLLSIATVTTLSRADFHDGLSSLPLPRTITVLLAQIVAQTGTLADETGRIRSAVALRGATGLRVALALPRVWLPRIVLRAERLTAAMELRGYDTDAPALRKTPIGRYDGLLLGLAVVWAVLVVALRLRGLA